MANFTTYSTSATNIMYEDLIDVVTNIDPVDTYVLSHAGKTRAKARYHEWDTDSLLTTQTGGAVEGADFTGTAITAADRTGNYTQITRREWAITDSMLAFETAGGNQEMYQMARHLKSLSNDIEYALLINTASNSGASGTARKSKGIDGWISDNVTGGSASGSAGWSAVSEAFINTALNMIWADGGKPQTALLGGFQKRSISDLHAKSRDIGLTSSVAEVQNAVDIYKSNFGTIVLKLHHHMETYLPGSIIFLGDMSLWNVAWARPIQPYDIGRTGGAKKYMVEAEYTLEARQEKGSGKLRWLTQS